MSKLKAFYHITWANNETGTACCQSYIDDMQLPWYQERFVLYYHLINDVHHTFLIRKRGVNKEFFEIGVSAMREAMRHG